MNAATLTSARDELGDDLMFLIRAEAGQYGDSVRDALRGLHVQPFPDDPADMADVDVADALIARVNSVELEVDA